MPDSRQLTLVLALLGLPDLAAAATPRANAPGPGSSPARTTRTEAPPVPKASKAAPDAPAADATSDPKASKPASAKPGKPASAIKPDSKDSKPTKPGKPETGAKPSPAAKPGKPAPGRDAKPGKPARDAEPVKPAPEADATSTSDTQAKPARPGKPAPETDATSTSITDAKPGKPLPTDTRPAPAPDPKASKPTSAAGQSSPVPQDSPQTAARPAKRPRAAARSRLRPRGEPLLAAHPAASCTLDPLEAVAQRQHQRSRASLREFYWSDMARFFESTFDESEPTPRQADDAAFLPAADVIAGLPRHARAPLTALAGARVVDRLSERPWIGTNKLLSSLAPAEVAALLRTDAPTLRAHVYTWLSTTKTGGCHLGHIDLDFLEAAVADRSIAVEHGDDLVYRSLGDYALEARARLASFDPARFDAFLVRLTAAGEVDPLVRATAHGILLRRAHWDTLELGLRDPSPPVRAATAAGAAEMSPDKVEARLVSHAAADPADLVTEQIVGALLGVHDPHNHGRPQVRGLLASTRDERLSAAVARWRGRGDPLAPLPLPAKPLRFAAAQPVPTDSPAVTQPVPADSPSAVTQPVPTDSPQRPSGASPVAAAAIHDAAEPPLPGKPRLQPRPVETPRSGLPSVLDRDADIDDHTDDDDGTIRIPPVRP